MEDWRDGHAALSVAPNKPDGTPNPKAKEDTYGLWPDKGSGLGSADRSIQGVPDNGAGSDVRKNLPWDRRDRYKYQFSVCISEEQYIKLLKVVSRNVTWTETHNCSSFASDTFYEVTGIDIDADIWWGPETPGELGSSISEANKARSGKG